MSVNERFLFLIKSLKMTVNSFSNEIGISQSSIRSIVDNVNQPSAKILIPLLERFPEVNANWLLTGKGDMFLDLSETKTLDEKLLHSKKMIDLLEISVEDLRGTIGLQSKTIEVLEKEIRRLEEKDRDKMA